MQPRVIRAVNLERQTAELLGCRGAQFKGEAEGQTSRFGFLRRANERHTANIFTPANRLQTQAVEAGARLIHGYKTHCDILCNFMFEKEL